jgi:DNA-binding response OmpR family regulator
MSNSPEKLLIIEDEESIGEGLKFNFELEGFEVVWIKDGAKGLEALESMHQSLSVVILDIMLPNLSGLDVLFQTRAFAEQIPILVLSARGSENDKVKALELGADDYVTKPFSLMELLLRVKGLAKRRTGLRLHTQNKTETVVFGAAKFNPQHLSVQAADGKPTRASPTEFTLVQVFLENPNRIITRAELLERVWNYDAKTETRTVDVFVGKLRRMCEVNPAKPEFLISVRGVGYAYVTNPEIKEQLLVPRP